jgi:predicted ATPase
MLKEVRFENWKSFNQTILYIDPLTVLIGRNASGKSNALDALQLLNRLASGINITAALAGDANIKGIRGGLEWACLTSKDRFALEVLVEADGDEQTDYLYRIEIIIQENTHALVFDESLRRFRYRPNTRKNPYEVRLFRTDECASDDPYITARLYNEKQGSPRASARASSILSQLATQKVRKEIDEGVQQVIAELKNIFILDPIPSHMRDYSLLSEQLEPDASNIAGVLAALDKRTKTRVEKILTGYMKDLPEKDVQRIYAEPVGKFGRDAMLYCDELWGKGKKNIHSVDARGMSDGSLRFLGVITALLTRPERSVLVVEEVDNGLHPSRSDLLVRMLKEIGQQRSIDIIVTTHNPALLDALGPEMVPFITVSHRDPATGQSQLTLLENIVQLPKLLAGGPVGKISSEGRIEEALHAIRS